MPLAERDHHIKPLTAEFLPDAVELDRIVYLDRLPGLLKHALCSSAQEYSDLHELVAYVDASLVRLID
jgi:hypothetical protein